MNFVPRFLRAQAVRALRHTTPEIGSERGQIYFLSGTRSVPLELRRVRRVAVDDFRVEHFFFLGELEPFGGALAERDASIEAGAIADVAARAAAGDADLEPDAILIVVDHDLDDFLHEAARR